MNSQEYWKRRTLYAKQKQLDHERDYELAMRARLQSLENEIIKEARHWILKYASENNLGFKEAVKLLNQINTSRFDMTLAEFEAKAKAGGYEKELNSAYYKSRIARLQKLQQQFIEFAGNYADKEEGIMAKTLADQYQFTYDQDNYSKYLVTGGIDVDYAHFNEDQLRSIVYHPWQGSDFSKRIWNNYTNVLPEVLTGTMFKATALGYSHSRIEQELRSAFRNVENNNLHRLIVTEMGHIAEQATADFYEDSEIEQYQYLATLEVHTCEICAHLDERIFYVKDRKPGLNYPLIHPYCRCTTVPYMEGLPDIESRWARDPETGKSRWVKNQLYNQWPKSNKSKPYTFDEWKKISSVKPFQLGIMKALPVAELNKEEEQAIRQYVSSDSYKINYALRNNEILSQDQQNMIKNLDNALRKMPRYISSRPLQRDYFFMYDDDKIEFLREMDKPWFEDSAYVSTSKIHYGEGTEQVHVIIINSRSGRDITKFNENEQEVLFPRNTRFRIVDSYTNNDGILTIIWEES